MSNKPIELPIQPGNACMWKGQMAILKHMYLDQRIIDGVRVDAIAASLVVRENTTGGVQREAWLNELTPYTYVPE